MGTVADKLAYLSDTKSAIRTAIGSDSIADDTTFRAYADIITDKLTNVVYHEAIGSSLSITDAINARFDSIKIFGKSTQSGTPTPENPVEIVSLDCTSATFTVDDTVLALPAVDELGGIPVDTGGTYTDENGQQWLCDYIDITAKRIVQQTAEMTVNGSGYWNKNSTVYYKRVFDYVLPSSYILCAAYKCDTGIVANMADKSAKFGFPNSQSYLYFKNDDYATADAFAAEMNANPVIVRYALPEPIITPLTDEQVEAFMQLYTSADGTIITNSMGADMAVVYLKR